MSQLLFHKDGSPWLCSACLRLVCGWLDHCGCWCHTLMAKPKEGQ